MAALADANGRQLLAGTAFLAGLGNGDDMRELSYVENAGGPFSVTATTEATANAIVTAGALTLDGSLSIIVEWGAASLIPGATMGDWINMVLFDNGSSIGILGGAMNDAYSGGTLTGSIHAPVHQARRIMPSAGPHTFSIRAFVNAGTGTVNAGAGGAGSDMPAYIRVVTAG